MPLDQKPIRLKLAGTVANTYTEIVPPEFTLEQVMDADYWVHVRKQLRLHDIITAIAADGSFDADLRITSINQITGTMTFRILRHYKGAALPVAPAEEAPRFDTRHKGNGNWCVVELASGNVVADGFTKAGAEAEKAKLETVRKAA